MKKEALIQIIENLDISDIDYFKVTYTDFDNNDYQTLEYDK